ncbi:hypothetical protein CEP54_005677 [Fusarium duplospermum]|uniref:Alkaline proteinase n=1 Tax=Fusarium duplospermum TaxID=1325734 RepID=A0A428QB78_9HYPO|nr:hypothetical protein CEP54_005677 [Fusarium duplospermum]
MVNFKNFAIVATTLLSCVVAAPAPASSSSSSSTGPSDIIPGSYIVTLKPSIKVAKVKAHIKWVKDVHKRSLTKRDTDNGIEKTYDNEAGFHAYSGTFDASTIKQIKKSPDVIAVEPDRLVKLTWNPQVGEPSENNQFGERDHHEDHDSEDEPTEDVHLSKRAETNQNPSTWGLGTISHRAKGYKNYLYDSDAGIESYAYVVDSGVRASHKDFGGRVKQVWTAFSRDHTDRLGHGTHVAGTIAGKTYGVAKKAQILAVKVFQGDSAELSVILSGINWAVNDVVSKNRQKFAVINLSLGIDDTSAALNRVVENAVKAGVITVVASGNAGMDTAKTSPGSVANAITVGAIDSNWKVTSWSNWGSFVDILAPGVGVISCSWKSDTGTAVEDGTSMAAPHVSGLVLYAQSIEGIFGVTQTSNWLKKVATADQITGNLRGTKNLIANNNNYQQRKIKKVKAKAKAKATRQ